MKQLEERLLDQARRERLVEINALSGSRPELEARYGRVWDATELASDFTVIGFMAPYVVVERRSDAQTGSLEFQHHPRFYFGFTKYERPSK